MDDEKLIQQWLKGELSKEEVKAFEAMEEAPFYKDIIQDAQHFKASNFSKVDDFDTFKRKVIQPHAQIEKGKVIWLRPLLRIASVVVVALGLFYFFLFDNATEVQTMVAEKTTVELPDASRVVLNAASQIRFDAADWQNNRVVKLDGEAFFDVEKGAKFDVETSEGTVSVLGTEFNVKQRGNFFEVACYEGTVRVVSNGRTEILKVGDSFTSFDSTVYTDTTDHKEPQWTVNKSYFERIPVAEVFSELERQYGITVVLEDVDPSQLFTGGFAHDNLKNAVLAVGEPLGLEYEILKGTTVRFNKRD